VRIGIFTDTYSPYISGVVTSIKMLEKALIAKGHEVFIVTINFEDMEYKYERNGKLIKIPGISAGVNDCKLSFVYPVKVVKHIKDWDLDIIHSHTEFSVGTFARIIGTQLNIPVVHTYHTMYEDYMYYVTKGYFDSISKKLLEYLTKFSCDKTVQELIVPSQKTYNFLKENYKMNKNIHIIPTGIDIDKFDKKHIDINKLNQIKKQLGLTKKDRVILTICRIAKEKNLELLINSQNIINKNHKNYKLIIVGSGPELDFYQNKSKKNKNIIFTGPVPWDDISYYYHIGDVFVTASKTETQGLTVIEALASNLPTVCIDDASFQNVVINDLNGKVFKTKNEYIKCIYELLQDDEKLKTMSKQARISAEYHSLKFYAEKILNVYLIATKGKIKKHNFLKRIVNKIKRSN